MDRGEARDPSTLGNPQEKFLKFVDLNQKLLSNPLKFGIYIYIYILDLEDNLHSIWVIWISSLQEYKGNFFCFSFFLSKSGRLDINFQSGSKTILFYWGCQIVGPNPYPPPLKVHMGRFGVQPPSKVPSTTGKPSQWTGRTDRLGTNEQVDVQDIRIFTDCFKEIYRIYLKSLKKTLKITTCSRLDLETLGCPTSCPGTNPNFSLATSPVMKSSVLKSNAPSPPDFTK